MFYSCIYTLFALTCLKNVSEELFANLLFIFFFCINLLLDILLTFRTSYKDLLLKCYIRDCELIKSNYSKSWFFLDLISSLPLEIIISHIFKIKSSLKLFHIMSLYDLIRLVKMFRFIRIWRVFKLQISDYMGFKRRLYYICFILFIMIFITHFAACGWYWIGLY